ncbi:hypothetical protein NDA11_000900 [Ustilago hordei]|uniref:Glc8 protein n=1 Tax=Ustilago hordei TaxID=120017 RepID=I2FWU0_USTHO|nr:uncharacterized protein UHO2_04203 [Ustilago hordei]KAJ1037156.1 hypothetical protein NDA10_007691 [Ustilago hordei]KAJ1573819.1 hypothetical protein NDA15_004513 [Ustilago hordei]KAJ1579228.1 hypothetical protein NDA11_000900 [Ustilago hordei]KAJ1579756.1 hypothetical protein NDA12_006345 [Ustilago hordei]KAJ1598456.1 hypothetical protein NDA14_000993 [Ustilago hordei]
MSSPRHSPPPSAAAPKPKGILKNAGERRRSQGEALSQEDDANRLQWDETNLTLHEIEREHQEARMKIDEPKTPFVHDTALGPVGDDDLFDLDGAAPRRGSVADQLAANTSANAGRAPGEDFGLAVGLDAAELAKGNTASNLMSVDSNQVRANSIRSTSRSPSFSLPPKSPSSRRSSSRSATAAAADDDRSGVRQQANEMQVGDQDDGEVEEEDADPETQAKHAAFTAKRNQHYGNEAEVMKIAASLASYQDEDDEEEVNNEI